MTQEFKELVLEYMFLNGLTRLDGRLEDQLHKMLDEAINEVNA